MRPEQLVEFIRQRLSHEVSQPPRGKLSGGMHWIVVFLLLILVGGTYIGMYSWGFYRGGFSSPPLLERFGKNAFGCPRRLLSVCGSLAVNPGTGDDHHRGHAAHTHLSLAPISFAARASIITLRQKFAEVRQRLNYANPRGRAQK